MITLIVVAIISLVAGGIITYIILKIARGKQSARIIQDAETEAEMIRKDKILQAKEKFLHLKSEHEKFINERNLKLAQAENKLKQRETVITQKIE
jgi:ribonuclease Y